MAIRERVPSKFSRALLWRFVMIGLSVLSLALLGYTWFSGSKDTKDALMDGRRLLITLETGAIEGKQTSLETTETPKEEPTAAPDAAPSPATAATSPAAATTPAAKPEASATSPATATTTADKAATAPAHAPESKGAADMSAMPANPSEPFANQDVSTDMAQSAQIKPALVPLPEVKEVLLEKTAQGNIPMLGPKGLKPWQAYAKPYAHKGHLPTIAIVISGLGQNKIASDAALRLPENVSLSFSPYAKDVTNWAHAARVAGHEILLDLPLEPNNFPASDPGPYGLLTGKGTEENNKRLQWLMSRTEGYVGFVPALNEAFSGNDAAFKDLLEQFSSRGIMMALARDPAKTETRRILDESKTAYVIADAVIDEDLSVTAIQARLLSLEKVASKRGFAVGLGQAYPLTMQELAVWSSDLEKNGFTLAPITFITKLKFPVQ